MTFSLWLISTQDTTCVCVFFYDFISKVFQREVNTEFNSFFFLLYIKIQVCGCVCICRRRWKYYTKTIKILRIQNPFPIILSISSVILLLMITHKRVMVDKSYTLLESRIFFYPTPEIDLRTRYRIEFDRQELRSGGGGVRGWEIAIDSKN